LSIGVLSKNATKDTTDTPYPTTDAPFSRTQQQTWVEPRSCDYDRDRRNNGAL